MDAKPGTYVKHKINNKEYFYRHFYDPKNKTVKAVREDPPHLTQEKRGRAPKDQMGAKLTQAKSKRKSVKLQADTHARLSAIAKQRNVSMNDALALLLDSFEE